MSEPRVRRATPDDEALAAELLYRSAADMYDRFAGGRQRALLLLRAAFRSLGTDTSAEVVWIAELDGHVAGAMAAFPVEEARARGRRLLRLALRSAPPWRWPAALWLHWAGGRATPCPPPGCLYVDALATDPSLRRRGAARALLAEAERVARKRGLRGVALDAAVGNRAARALYASAGFDELAYRPAGRALPGFVALAKPLR